MFLIFGLRRRLAQLALLPMMCANGHTAAQRVIKTTLWFTLFFMRVIPVSTKYTSVCVQCGRSSGMTKDEAYEAAQRIRSPRPRDLAGVEPLAPLAHAAGQMPDPGWFADPSGQHSFRWWDGANWTEWVHPARG
jgi:Protein of unknown function (DUF2510)